MPTDPRLLAIADRLMTRTKPPNRGTHGNVTPSPYTVSVGGQTIYRGTMAPEAFNVERIAKAAIVAALAEVRQ